MEYPKGYVFELMAKGGPTDIREPYFMEAVDEMMRARVLCAKANAKMPDDPTYVEELEELFGRKLDDVRILTPFICDFGNSVKMGKGVFINHSAILSASGGIEFEDGVQVAPGVRIATINHDFNERHTKYTYGKVTIKKNAWIGMNVTICPGVTIGKYAVVAAGAVVTKDIPDYAVAGGVPAKVIKMQNPEEQKEE
jgi:acetyltransferase-like isoleucine patch superfamily enzyme